MTIAISNSDTSIQSTTKLLDNCHYHKEKCPTESSIQTWNAADVNVCRLKKGISTKYVLTSSRLSCPEVNIAMTKFTQQSICNLTLGVSAQGIIFTHDKPWQSTDFYTTYTKELTHIVKNKIRTGRSVKKQSRGEEPLTPWTIATTFEPTTEINVRFQYLYDLVGSNVTYSLQALHKFAKPIRLC